ncbi:hypothetical protein AN958_07209 [Leucoagaricus sp. SymC.cos]|nr:hypothetical protein AN958_07209 [Leucoagaricus sp. SymC.cos]
MCFQVAEQVMVWKVVVRGQEGICPHPPHCLNCHQAHTATSKQCPFWHHQFDKDWLCSKYQEIHCCHNAHSSTSNASLSHV